MRTVVRRRLTRRHEGQDAALRWHLHRCGELDEVLGSARVEDAVVDATDLTVAEAAAAVVRTIGWDDGDPGLNAPAAGPRPR